MRANLLYKGDLAKVAAIQAQNTVTTKPFITELDSTDDNSEELRK